MNSSEIERALRHEFSTKDLFVGVFAADQLPQEKEFPGGYIANTDASGQNGEHWGAFYCEKGVIECFDSFGAKAGSYSPFIDKWLDGEYQVMQKEKIQSVDSTVCGQYSMFFILLKCNGFSYQDILSVFTTNRTVNDKFVCKFINNYFHLATTVVDKAFLISSLRRKRY